MPENACLSYGHCSTIPEASTVSMVRDRAAPGRFPDADINDLVATIEKFALHAWWLLVSVARMALFASVTSFSVTPSCSSGFSGPFSTNGGHTRTSCLKESST